MTAALEPGKVFDRRREHELAPCFRCVACRLCKSIRRQIAGEAHAVQVRAARRNVTNAPRTCEQERLTHGACAINGSREPSHAGPDNHQIMDTIFICELWFYGRKRPMLQSTCPDS